MDQQFLGFIDFENEHGFSVQVGVKYEWKPVSCSHCSGLGHTTEKCRKNTKGKQEWVVKEDKRLKQKTIDEGGFMDVTKGYKVADTAATKETLKVDYAFQGLEQEEQQDSELGMIRDQPNERWCFSSNIAWHAGRKIVIAWNLLRFIVDIIRCTSQVMHLRIVTADGIFDSYLTVVYASNSRIERRELWRDVCELAPIGKWCLMGDFNEILSKEERIGHRHGEDRIYFKIDRILANQSWLNAYENAEATFLNEELFDHSPKVLTLYPHLNGGIKPFKYFRMWKSHSKYDRRLEEIWKQSIGGSKMFQVVSRMKLFKAVLKDINKEGYMDLQAFTAMAKANLDNIQTRLQQNPLDFELHNEEKVAWERYVKVQQDYVSFLR
ncbi:uncharacterized protein LOC133039294 [Cannabis sativa]|uniref:uncharacterized protein LOC133039294 n=1 Tax=Cannabis sativa TaxID=3483 RepID=UPI0029CA196F|nr:uncharacterized protein LOC133039294 [Cannabis sativa]